MADAVSQAEAVKIALQSGIATVSTVTTLQSLLSSEVSNKTKGATNQRQTGRNPVQGESARSSRSAATRTVKTRKPQSLAIHEDTPNILPPKQRYALATSVVNISLKALTEALKTREPCLTTTEPSETSSGPKTPRRPARAPSSAREQALQPRSGNITPRSASPKQQRKSQDALQSTHSKATQATAECARLGFAYLRGVSPAKLGVRELPPLQLENGMLSLVGKLTAHGLDALAVRELRALKRRLEAASGRVVQTPSASTAPDSKPTETLATLLHLEVCENASPDLLCLASAYQLCVLKAISTSKKPRVIEAAATYLTPESELAVSKLLLRYLETSGDQSKATKVVEDFSTSLLALCPSVSSTADSAASDRNRHPDPKLAFRLQCAALRLRKEITAGSGTDVERTVFEPFSKCLSTVVRRTNMSKPDAHELYRLASPFQTGVFNGVCSPIGIKSFSLGRALCSLAEEAGLLDEAKNWAYQNQNSCSDLPENHALRLAADARVIAHLQHPREQIEKLAELVITRLDGSCSDYEVLVEELARLSYISKPGFSELYVSSLSLAAARFAQRFARAYPLKSNEVVRGVIQTALIHHGQTPTSETEWISKDTIEVFVQAGIVENLAGLANTQPLKQVWQSSRDALCFDRAVGLLVRRCLRTSTKLDLQGWQLSPEARGILLECQFGHLPALAHKAKYYGMFTSMLDSILRELSVVYAPDAFPLRRTRVATAVYQLHTEYPTLMSAETLELWQSCLQLTEEGELEHDQGLLPLMDDIRSSLAMVRLLQDRRPSAVDLGLHLQSWNAIMTESTTTEQLVTRINDPDLLICLLRAAASVTRMMGDENTSSKVLRLRVEMHKRLGSRHLSQEHACSASLDLADCYLQQGYAESAESVLEAVRESFAGNLDDVLLRLRYEIARSDLLLSIDRPEAARSNLEQTMALRNELPASKVPRSQRRSYELVHARGWLMYSRYLLASGSAHDAVIASKRSMRLFNSIWKHVDGNAGTKPTENTADEPEPEPEQADIGRLASGIKKLQLTDNSKKDEKSQELKGASYWPILPDLCQSFLHLSALYCHYGQYSEANFYCESALKLAESVASKAMCSSIRSRRAQLLILAGRLEEAELCLSAVGDGVEEPSIVSVDRLRAVAALKLKEGDAYEASSLLRQAGDLVQTLVSRSPVNTSKSSTSNDSKSSAQKTVRKSTKSAPSRTTSKPAPKTSRTQPAVDRDRGAATITTCYLLEKLAAKIETERLAALLQAGNSIECSKNAGVQLMSWSQTRLQYAMAFNQASELLNADFCYNVLPESTISLPALRTSERRAPVTTASKAAPKTGRRNKTTPQSFAELLIQARACLVNDCAARPDYTSFELHSRYSMLANASMLLSAAPANQRTEELTSSEQAFVLEYARMHAELGERQLVSLERRTPEAGGFGWFDTTACSRPEMVNTHAFSSDYLDVLPKTWTTVSMSLNETCTELYVARYVADQAPFVVRLPFARHKPESDEEESFDFQSGKEELQEIIELSNYSCHSTTSETKKKTWWAERESLDKRLHELLINIENVWFGGFKSLFALQAPQQDLLSTFRKSFEAILERHLPSRRAAKAAKKNMALDDKVLGLFIGLGSDHDGAVDLDESLADLLYFVIDILQFNGERNAYDEVDLDSMATETLDALRAYHEADDSNQAEDRHLILVLDRRLHVFPWESMPCLDGASVSRVGSMQSLKERLTTLRKEHSATDHLTVPRTQGTYILNPSSDLPSTEAALLPTLSQLPSHWTPIVNRAPSEETFSTALQTSPITLYFGHGAGSQYIRPRTIKKLPVCSDVVWLMGCSSGAATEHGELEPQAVPLAYLLAGNSDPATTSPAAPQSNCKAVAATLWDVTDKDIDRFSLAVGEAWGLWNSSPTTNTTTTNKPAKTPKKPSSSSSSFQRSRSPATPKRPPKTPAGKTPKPFARTPSRGDERGVRAKRGVPGSLSRAVAESREVCYLRYLNGAATVVYGVPVYLDGA